MTTPIVEMHLDLTAVSQQLDDLAFDQLPYATSLGVNDVAQLIRDNLQANLRSVMQIRRDWVVGGVAVLAWSNKHQAVISATIGVRPDRYFLDKFEDGGTKLPRHGSDIAIPVDGSVPVGNIPTALRPKNLRFVSWYTKSGKEQLKGLLRSFILRLTSGQRGIFQRTGPGKGDVKMLYVLVPSARIPAILGFRQETERVLKYLAVPVIQGVLKDVLAGER